MTSFDGELHMRQLYYVSILVTAKARLNDESTKNLSDLFTYSITVLPRFVFCSFFQCSFVFVFTFGVPFSCESFANGSKVLNKQNHGSSTSALVFLFCLFYLFICCFIFIIFHTFWGEKSPLYLFSNQHVEVHSYLQNPHDGS